MTVIRIVAGIAFGATAIFFLFLSVVGFRGGHAGAGVVLCLAAIAGAITYFLLSPRPKKAKRRRRLPSREGAMPEYEDPLTRTALNRQAPASEGWRKFTDPNSWNFDIAIVTPAGWIFGVISCLVLSGGMGLLLSSFGVTGVDIPRWAIKVFGVFLLAPVIVYFVYGAKVMRSLGFPVFREDRSKPSRNLHSQRRSGGVKSVARRERFTPPSLPPRRKRGTEP